MGWSYCGKDSEGRDIGYSIPAKCDHPGCDKDIDRGLSYACGGEHGDDTLYCEKYFCHDHLFYVDEALLEPEEREPLGPVCASCLKLLESRADHATASASAAGPSR